MEEEEGWRNVSKKVSLLRMIKAEFEKLNSVSCFLCCVWIFIQPTENLLPSGYILEPDRASGRQEHRS